MTENEYFEVNFTNNPVVKPETVKVGDIAEILLVIESMVESQIYNAFPESKKEDVVIGFTKIRDSSVDLQFRSHYKDVVRRSFQQVGHAVSTKDYSVLPEQSYQTCVALLKFTRKYQCHAELVSQNGKIDVLAVITPETRIELPSPIKGETTIFARVIRVGGEKPKVEVKTVDGVTLYCDAPLRVTTALGAKLYQVVGLIGIAKWDYKLNNIEEFTIQDVTEYEAVPFKQAMEELAKATKQYYSGIDDVDKYITDLRSE